MDKLRNFLYSWQKDVDIYFATAEDEYGDEFYFINELTDFLEDEEYQYQLTPLNIINLDNEEADNYILIVLNEEKGEPEMFPIHLEY